MPICIECSYPVPQLYHVLQGSNHTSTHGAASSIDKGRDIAKDIKSLNSGRKNAGKRGTVVGGDVRLTQCPRCKRFADKYVEHDFVVLFCDLVLVKPQVYRHLLFNRLGRDDDEFDPSIPRLGILLLLFDVYLTWSTIETLPASQVSKSPIPSLPILLQYIFYLAYCISCAAAQHVTIRFLSRFPPYTASHSSSDAMASDNSLQDASVHSQQSPRHRPNALSTALFVSSSMKLFPILMIVWRYSDDKPGIPSETFTAPSAPAFGGGVTSIGIKQGVEWAVAIQNIEAVRILLGCGYIGAAILVGAGAVARWAVARLVLGCVGLE